MATTAHASAHARRPARRVRADTSGGRRPGGNAFIYALLLVLAAVVILLPLGWMLTVALKPDNAPVFTLPPEWFPTAVLGVGELPPRADRFDAALPALHPQHD